MTDWGSAQASAAAVAAFLASVVECIEALTVVLAVGAVRGWRGSLVGAASGLAVLFVLTLALGPALVAVPVGVVQVLVGGLLLLFGLRWLRKAILRSAGIIPLHDEASAYAKQAAALRGLGATLAALDRVAVATSFKIVILEGIEVVFIVIAIGSSGKLLLPAASGAALALLVVCALGLVLHRPIASVPENTLKFAVGVLLCAFGTFWLGEGIGAAWPGADWSLPALVAFYLLIALGCVRLARSSLAAMS